MKDTPLISIIIPVYNLENYVQECLESIIKQTYKNIEIIIIDDGSTDKTISICEEIANADNRVKFIKQEHSGVVIARGKGISISRGKYIMFIDGDDWIEHNMIEVLLNNMQNVDMVSSGVYKEVAPNKILKQVDNLKKGISDIEYILKNIFNESLEEIHLLTPINCNKLFKSKIVKEIYCEIDSSITYGEDTLFLYKYLLKCESVMIIDECFYHYRWREGSVVHSINKQRLIDINKIYLSLEKDFREHVLSDILLLHLESWVIKMIGVAINEVMGFEKSEGIPSFIINTSKLEGKRIVLYGAGNMGKDAYKQLSRFGYEVVLWVDKNWEFYNKNGQNVFPIDDISKVEYDVIFIAIKNEQIVEEVKKELISKGVKKEALLWNKPMIVY